MLAAINFTELKEDVLKWVSSMKVGPARFRMNEGADTSIFTTCFALFIFDLFGEVAGFSSKEKMAWVDYINSFQDEETGYFLPENFSGELNGKPVHQLTAFCQSALCILGASPKFEFKFVDQWMRSDDLYAYLKEKGCFSGISSSGNTAMFVGIFLTFHYEMHRDNEALNRVNNWFEFHEASQIPSSGFWGSSMAKKYYEGFQNAFHQFEIYNYWGRDIPFHEKIVDAVLALQDKDGHFAPVPGGGGCHDYDAAAILINCGIKKGYRCHEVESALLELLNAILRNQNKDGGFCESRKRPPSVARVFSWQVLKYILSGSVPYLWYFRLRKTISNSRKKRDIITTHWTMVGRQWGQSDLWDTWFRCLTIAEIDLVLNKRQSKTKWNFQKCIGLGFFNI